MMRSRSERSRAKVIRTGWTAGPPAATAPSTVRRSPPRRRPPQPPTAAAPPARSATADAAGALWAKPGRPSSALLDQIADAAHRLDQLDRIRVVDLGAQPADRD